MMTARDTHLHFKHLTLTHRRIGTYNRFADRDKTCRICRAAYESSTHLGECPRIVKILETLDKLTRFAPRDDRSREEVIIDNLFMHPGGKSPRSITILYTLAWRYITTDFYIIHYDGIEFSEESVLIRTLDRYTTLSKALLFAICEHHGLTDSARTAQAGMGRQPKKRIDTNDIYPLFTVGTRGNLEPSLELQALTNSMGVTHIIAGEPEREHS